MKEHRQFNKFYFKLRSEEMWRRDRFVKWFAVKTVVAPQNVVWIVLFLRQYKKHITINTRQHI